MDQLIKSLPTLLASAGDAEEIKEAAAIAAWNHVAGEALRQQAVPLRLSGQKLEVAVADAIWQTQLAPMAGLLLSRLNSLLGQTLVAYIEFLVDPESVRSARKPETLSHKRASDGQAGAQPIPFELLFAAGSIQDAGLRRAFLGAACSCVNRLERA